MPLRSPCEHVAVCQCGLNCEAEEIDYEATREPDDGGDGTISPLYETDEERESDDDEEQSAAYFRYMHG